ncbi:signal transduction histidine kinase [Sanguibacter keddieii DSM 10542]|uniref:histidine kinase n=1 Tax=Sanguibacter keddieii (strain ATCC 51767 / DSM 10542 / NCFB 3025 / ST-74) TaxID=446469 RepID=D1BGN8_SANKS|nr:signal transduction histidine kinase [Sanguibacter keddieii DSM 10542]
MSPPAPTRSTGPRDRLPSEFRPEPPATWWPEVTAGALTLASGLWEIVTLLPHLSVVGLSWVILMTVRLGMVTAAAAMFRRAPGSSLALVWSALAVQLAAGSTVSHAGASALVVVLVAFGAARHGRRLTLWAAAASLVLSTALTVLLVMAAPGRLQRLPFPLRGVTENVDGPLGGVVLGLLLGTGLLVPWAFGGALRLRERARRSEDDRMRATAERDEADRQRSLAEEVAALRSVQARLARDVHDVVGHSLAVVLAQAESAQYLPDDDPAALRRAMASIATSARTSLVDVRQVLASIDGEHTEGPAPRGTLDTLLDDVRAAGTPVEEDTAGTARPLPPELETVTYRVLQEMLTNALKHGARGEPVQVERVWGEDLLLAVENVGGPVVGTDVAERAPTGGAAADEAATVVDASEAAPFVEGLGLASMRRRLTQVGGTLDITRSTQPDGSVRVRAEARVPLGRTLRTTADHVTPEDRA